MTEEPPSVPSTADITLTASSRVSARDSAKARVATPPKADVETPVEPNPFEFDLSLLETVPYPDENPTASQGASASNISVDLPDPLSDESPGVWYVRNATGSQYGPVDPTVMRSWLAEGRITKDTIVWRDGWDDWRRASDVFPKFRANPGAKLPPIPTATGADGEIQIRGDDRLVRGARSRPGAKPRHPRQVLRTRVVWTVALSVAVLFLTIVLGLVLSR